MADLHVHKGRPSNLRPIFTEISAKADILALCGDLTNLGLPDEADQLAQDLSSLSIPAVAVLGNHDHQSGKVEEVMATLRKAGVTFLEDAETHEVRGVGFAGVKGFGGGFSSHMLASFGEESTKHFVAEAVSQALLLEHSLSRLGTDRSVVLLHYLPIAETAKGEALEIYPFLGCSRFAEAIDRFNVVSVFHGHAHRGYPSGHTTKGVPVYNVSMELLQSLHQRPYVVVEV
jgi:Icc-related predicted phosphoesterase